jgi:phosphatidyl-myo-inositol dimannoside synthase
MHELRVLVLTPDFPPAPGGIQITAHRVVAHASRLAALVVALDGPGAGEFDRKQAFPVHRVAASRVPHRARIAALNASGLREGLRFHPQVVLNMHVVTSPAAWALRRLLSAPVVQYVHADEMRARPRLTRRAVQAADAVVAVSSHTEQLALDAGAVPPRLNRIPNGVDLPDEVSTRRSGDPVVLTVGRLTQPYKGHDVMLRALPLVRRRVPSVRWVVIGDGPLRPRLEREVAESGLADAVRFLGVLSDSERDRWFDRAHVFAMPSRLPPGEAGGEGFGIVYLEAAAHGVPVVAGGVGGALDAVEDGRTGLLVDPTDPKAIAGALTELLLDPGRREALGRAGAERAREFAWPKVARRVEDVLMRVAS